MTDTNKQAEALTTKGDQEPRTALGMFQALQEEGAALPPLFFDLKQDPHQFTNLAEDPAHAARVKEYAQKALSKRMRHAEKTLTHYRATPQGLEERILPHTTSRPAE